VEFLCTVDSIIAHCVLVSFVPFHPADLIESPFSIAAKASSYVSVDSEAYYLYVPNPSHEHSCISMK